MTLCLKWKILYAHKTMLNLVSDTFDSMLSDRWAKKDVPIKIETYSYDNFYQFLTFLYSAQCELTDENIFAMVDLAEFYAVDIFKTYCDEYLAVMKVTPENIFKLMELAEKYSMNQLKASTHLVVINNFQGFANCDGFLKADKSFIAKLVIDVKDKIKPEELFQAVFKWCETQAANKHSVDPNLNRNDTIKHEISDLLPHVFFDKMEMKFMLEFVVPRGFIFSSLDELSKVLSDRFLKPLLQSRVKVTNSRGQTLHGTVIPDQNVIENIKSLKFSPCSYGINVGCGWNTKFTLPTTPSPLKKRDDILWYLVYFANGGIGVTRFFCVGGIYYLLAELTAGDSGFDAAFDCKIEIE